MKRLIPLAVALLLVACASQPEYVWQKPGANDNDWEMDLGQCRAQAFGTANVTLMQAAIVQTSCLRGKGWRQVPRS